jgi:hypothetical protein
MGFLHIPSCVVLSRLKWTSMDWSPDPPWSRFQQPSPELLFFASPHNGFQLALGTGVAEHGNIHIDRPSSS